MPRRMQGFIHQGKKKQLLHKQMAQHRITLIFGQYRKTHKFVQKAQRLSPSLNTLFVGGAPVNICFPMISFTLSNSSCFFTDNTSRIRIMLTEQRYALFEEVTEGIFSVVILTVPCQTGQKLQMVKAIKDITFPLEKRSDLRKRKL